jgi:DNA mismatch repair protein MutL
MQHQLHPQTLVLSPEDFETAMMLSDEIATAGFHVKEFGKNTILIEAIPSDCPSDNASDLFEGFLEEWKSGNNDTKLRKDIKIAKAIAKSMAKSIKKKLQAEEMENIIGQLLACNAPESSPDGSPALMFISYEDLNKKFK